MGHKELVDSLRAEGRRRASLMRREADEKAAQEAARAESIIGELKSLSEARARAESRLREEEIISSGRAKERSIRLEAEAKMAERLREAAFSCLAGMRGRGYERVFKALASELPTLKWQSVRVNPADLPLAAECFGGAEAAPDGAITGGMEATAEDGAVRVINTFEKRLEKSWDDMLPSLMGEVYEVCRPGA